MEIKEVSTLTRKQKRAIKFGANSNSINTVEIENSEDFDFIRENAYDDLLKKIKTKKRRIIDISNNLAEITFNKESFNDNQEIADELSAIDEVDADDTLISGEISHVGGIIACTESGEYKSEKEYCDILNFVIKYHIDTENTNNNSDITFDNIIINPKVKEKWNLINYKNLKDKTLKEAKVPFTPLQDKLFNPIFTYKDVLFQNESEKNKKELRDFYCLHSVNHVMNTRKNILQNNETIKLASASGEDIEEIKDQGFTRPTVLIITPFKETCFEIVQTLIQLSGIKQVENKKRFREDFHGEDETDPTKPLDHQKTFKGNIDDCFRVGLRFNQKSVKIYSDFYTSDIICASPLGLRMVIGDESEGNKDFDFLSSIQIVIVDQCDVLLMQNWEHIEYIFENLNLIPKDSHDCDFSRVRNFYLDGRSKYFRQTILLTRYSAPETNSIFGKTLKNIKGKFKTKLDYNQKKNLSHTNLVLQIPQVFLKFDANNISDLNDSRFNYFIKNVLAQISKSVSKSRTIIFIPSYFDFVRIRNYLKEHNYNFAQLSEYTSPQNISRARLNFFKGNVDLLLITERFHFFRRYHIRGSFQVVFYGLPSRSDFYQEFLNRIDVEKSLGEATSQTLFSKFDLNLLERVCGTARSMKMIEDGKSTFMFS
ncbi:rRNA-binding ribosome biosynthesis protein utp25 [Clydaea vesicula]|uniref:U3 small nucleolar RNA-associated protein 25 n=1 Tax=Clydaea vesicula TaxID=447962 RepID=A0AAD5U911_9FUNG|nr:rRNA-binding ribosome biosynthesis protein utp25 [Clydaea vesicula]